MADAHTDAAGTRTATQSRPVDSVRPMEPLRDMVLRLTIENDHMRKLLADADVPCMYCHLPRADMGKCQSGFPGCARADDMMYVQEEAPNVG